MQHRLGRFGWRWVGIVSLTTMLSFTLVGCGQGTEDEKMTPVVGTVTVGGKPLTTGSVTFHPDLGKGNSTKHIPVGILDSSAKYSLKSASADGRPGWYKVTVTSQAPIDPSNPYALPKHLIDPRFGDVATSGLRVEVVENAAPGAYDFELTK